jgi:hypothetical protein
MSPCNLSRRACHIAIEYDTESINRVEQLITLPPYFAAKRVRSAAPTRSTGVRLCSQGVSRGGSSDFKLIRRCNHLAAPLGAAADRSKSCTKVSRRLNWLVECQWRDHSRSRMLITIQTQTRETGPAVSRQANNDGLTFIAGFTRTLARPLGSSHLYDDDDSANFREAARQIGTTKLQTDKIYHNCGRKTATKRA